MTSVTRRNSAGLMSATRENTVSIASLIQMSTGPSFVLEPLGGGEQRVGVGDVDRFGGRLDAEGFELTLDVLERLLRRGR